MQTTVHKAQILRFPLYHPALTLTITGDNKRTVAVIVRKACHKTDSRGAVAVIRGSRLSYMCMCKAHFSHNVSLNIKVCLLHDTEI